VYEIPGNIRDVLKYVAAAKDHADVFVTCEFSWFYEVNILRKMHGKTVLKF
jgi:hypothetical protein